MRHLLILAAIILLPIWGWGQRRPATGLDVTPPKAETVQARYARLDQYAQHLPDTQAATLDKLAASLNTQAHSDDDKARLIFAWLTHHIAYDMAYLVGDTTRRYRLTPKCVLQSRKAICQGYADLFTALATRMKLEANTVTGHGRDEDTVGDVLNEAGGHAWNVYRIAGTWHLADATWGTGGTLVGTDEFVWQFEPFWFDTPPSQMIFTHLPDSIAWQLLPIPVTRATFQRWPYVKPTWFQLVRGVDLLRAFEKSKATAQRLPTIEIMQHIPAVWLVQAPLCGELVAGQPITFAFLAPDEVEMTIEMDTCAMSLKPSGLYRQATVIPTVGRINISIWYKANKTIISSLQYDVLPAPRQRKLQPGQHHLSPTTSVLYIRREGIEQGQYIR